ncbi:hypothetical protein [uncultured Aquimarina sp.]|uniref:hypothetical protein n=1 Tax=uncultured Aquimarina sp. TaxID=575652 RepID=UPI00262B837C|nr:hypothetical protein [uncultured Aquimarina sp.]
MEPMDIFYQILHEDLNPLTSQTTQNFNSQHSKNQKVPDEITKEKNVTSNTETFAFYENLLADTLKKVKRDIHDKVFKCINDPSSINSIIQNHQILILNYCRVIEQNYLLEDTNKKYQISEDKCGTDIFKLVYQTLDTILNYLEVSFNKYLEPSLEIPYQRRLWFVHQKKERCQLLIAMLNAIDIPPQLIEIICDPLHKIIHNDLYGFTYQQKEYYTLYIKVLFKLLSKDTIITEEVYAVLISLEFNTFKIFFYLRDQYLAKKVKRAYGTHKKINILHQFLKEIKTTTITSDTKYNPNLPSLKEQLLIWIREEINGLQRTIESSSSSIVKEKAATYNQNTKKILKLSVSEISLITRLLYEQGMLEGSKRTFFEFLSNTFKTNKTKVISPESLSNRYYPIPDSTKTSVKKILRGMLLKLDTIQSEV